MKKEKQIEEMAEMLDEMCDLDLLADCGEKDCSKCMATALYNAGYRKYSEGELMSAIEHREAEVAREIFKAIEKTVNDCVVGESLFKPAYFEFRKFNEHLAELKKKYTGGYK